MDRNVEDRKCNTKRNGTGHTRMIRCHMSRGKTEDAI
jgi:hypothetical protein